MDKNAKKDKNSFSTRRFKSGAYSTLLIAAAIVIVLLANLVVGRMGITFDISKQSLYTLSEDTDRIAGGLTDDITIYFIATSGKEEPLVRNVVEKYAQYDRIQVVAKDPLLYPNFTAQYTDKKVSDNSVIVVNETTGAAKYIAYADLLVLELAYDEKTGEPYNNATGIDAEGQITSALVYVTTEDLPTLYTVTGHGELELNGTIENEINKLNMKVETLETLSADRIPEDCDLLLINGPSYDFSADETAKVQEYLEAGGRAIIFAGYTDEEMPNLNTLLEYYGVQMDRGVIVEGYGHYMGQYLTYLLPEATSHEIAKEVDKPMIAAVSQGITLLDTVRSSLKAEPVLKSSADAYLKLNPNSDTMTQEAQDPSGPFVLGAAVTDTYQGAETKLAVFSSANFLHETMVVTNQFGNSEVLMNAIEWAVNLPAAISIPSKNIEQTMLTMSSAVAGRWAVGLAIVLPVALILAGFAIWYRRRRN